jgi:hypothetical protein
LTSVIGALLWPDFLHFIIFFNIDGVAFLGTGGDLLEGYGLTGDDRIVDDLWLFIAGTVDNFLFGYDLASLVVGADWECVYVYAGWLGLLKETLGYAILSVR